MWIKSFDVNDLNESYVLIRQQNAFRQICNPEFLLNRFKNIH